MRMRGFTLVELLLAILLLGLLMAGAWSGITTATKAAITLAANLAAGQCFDAYIWAPPNGSAVFYRLDEINTGTNLVDTSTTTTIPTNTAFMGPTLQMSNGTANTTVTTTAMEVMAFSCQSDN